jgi:hypothetical protein
MPDTLKLIFYICVAVYFAMLLIIAVGGIFAIMNAMLS